MKKKLFSIALIVVLISFTVAPLWGYSCISYATETELSDEQKCDLSYACYYNYRKGWFTGSSSGAVIGVIKAYIDQFFDSPSNITGINSYSDFASHVTVGKDSSGHWGVSIDNTGLTFLDNLCKWMLGKNDFSNLQFNGSWGSGQTQDSAYDGLIYNGSIFYVVKTTNDLSINTSYGISDDYVSVGSPVEGKTGKLLIDNYINNFNLTLEQFNSRRYNSQLGLNSNYSITERVNYYSNYYLDMILTRYYYPTDAYAPGLTSYPSGTGSLSVGSNGIYYPFIYSKATQDGSLLNGTYARILLKNTSTGINTIYNGLVIKDFNKSFFYVILYSQVDRNDQPNIDNAYVDLQTDNFYKDDVAPSNGDGLTFTPQTNNGGNTYSYYTGDDVTNFYNYYYNDYRRYYTIIHNPSSDPDPDPDPTPTPTPGGGSGSITPDGNGGYNFNLPDIGWPDFSGFDFNISGLSEKFPFSIPFDLMAFFTVLNAEPETPEIQCQIDLGIVQWDIDWNLEDFDGLASLLRNLEFIGFCLALILITRSIIKG